MSIHTKAFENTSITSLSSCLHKKFVKNHKNCKRIVPPMFYTTPYFTTACCLSLHIARAEISFLLNKILVLMDVLYVVTRGEVIYQIMRTIMI